MKVLAYLLVKFSHFSDTYFVNIISKVRSTYRCFRRVTPFLVAVVVMIAVYYFITGDLNFSDVSQYSNQNKSISPGWWFDAINYASLQIAAHLAFNCNGR